MQLILIRHGGAHHSFNGLIAGIAASLNRWQLVRYNDAHHLLM